MSRESRKLGIGWILLAASLSVSWGADHAFAEEAPPQDRSSERVTRSASSSGLQFGAFVDTYYAYDFNQPSTQDRFYTTQAARHNEFNVNLAFIEAKLDRKDVRGRFALQTGTSVTANYVGETFSNGQFSSREWVRHIQEAVVGYQFARAFWVDAGIYFSHLGAESFISRDNWTYSRSLSSDFSPYYQTGVRFSWQPSGFLGFQLHVLNGWQLITDTNPQKAVGTQIAITPLESLSLTHGTIFTFENGGRIFNDFVLKYSVTEELQFAAQFDVGLQDVPALGGYRPWTVFTLLGRWQFLRQLALGARFERFMDPDALIATVPTGYAVTSPGFLTTGASANLDWELSSGLLWRTEYRVLVSDNPAFPDKSGGRSRDTQHVVSSLALSL